MDEKKSNEGVYSGEPTKTTGSHSLRSTPETAESPGAHKSASTSNQSQLPPMADMHGIPRPGGQSPLTDFLEFLKRTKQVWLLAAAAIFGLWLVVTLVKRLSESVKASREARHQRVVGTLTAEGLLERCGKPAEDVTKEVYPIVMRTITYQGGENNTFVFEFSRTAEEKSDWVFLSMKDQSGAKNFDTPEAKVAAMPCLDSKK
jgi:hypothetical protein